MSPRRDTCRHIFESALNIPLNIKLVELDHPDLNHPVLICGLPGSAFVGKFALDHLVSDLPGSPLAEIYSAGFPPQIIDQRRRNFRDTADGIILLEKQ